jgi:hypothetical protein
MRWIGAEAPLGGSAQERAEMRIRAQRASACERRDGVLRTAHRQTVNGTFIKVFPFATVTYRVQQTGA